MDLGEKMRKMAAKRKTDARFRATQVNLHPTATASNPEPIIGQGFFIPTGSGFRQDNGRS